MINSEYSRKEVLRQRLRRAYMNANTLDELMKKCSRSQLYDGRDLIVQIHLKYEKRLRRRVIINLVFAGIGFFYILLIAFLKWSLDINLKYGIGLMLVTSLIMIYYAINFRLKFMKNIKTFSEPIHRV